MADMFFGADYSERCDGCYSLDHETADCPFCGWCGAKGHGNPDNSEDCPGHDPFEVEAWNER